VLEALHLQLMVHTGGMDEHGLCACRGGGVWVGGSVHAAALGLNAMLMLRKTGGVDTHGFTIPPASSSIGSVNRLTSTGDQPIATQSRPTHPPAQCYPATLDGCPVTRHPP